MKYMRNYLEVTLVLNYIIKSVGKEYDLGSNWLSNQPFNALDREFGCDLRCKLLTLETEEYKSLLHEIESVLESWAIELLK